MANAQSTSSTQQTSTKEKARGPTPVQEEIQSIDMLGLLRRVIKTVQQSTQDAWRKQDREHQKEMELDEIEKGEKFRDIQESARKSAYEWFQDRRGHVPVKTSAPAA